MMSAGVLLCLCPNEIVAMTIAFEMKPMMICSDVRTAMAYFSVGTDINDLLVLLILVRDLKAAFTRYRTTSEPYKNCNVPPVYTEPTNLIPVKN